MRNSFGVSRKDKFMEVDANRENLYNLCKENALTQREMSELMQLSLYKIKAYVGELVKNKHLEKVLEGASENNKTVVRFKSTEIAYKARTQEEIEDYLEARKSTPQDVKKGIYDDLIASNPNLRKICLFDTKPTKDFSFSGQKGKVNRSVSSAWGMFNSF
jgi:hypothetical protein